MQPCGTVDLLMSISCNVDISQGSMNTKRKRLLGASARLVECCQLWKKDLTNISIVNSDMNICTLFPDIISIASSCLSFNHFF